MKIAREESRARSYLVGLLGVTTLVLAGCNGSEDSDSDSSSSSESEAVTYPAASAASLATTSAADYNDNEYGLITGSTLMSWIDDWATNKPSGISGELIIIQVSEGSLTDAVDASCLDSDSDGTGVCKYFMPASGVRSYYLDSSTWVETRSNGVTETVSVVPTGEKMDALLSAYDIDPRSDMIVFAMGQGGGFQNMLMGRAYYMFRYWGVESSHLAMLNGGATHADVIPAGSRGTYLGEANSGAAPTGGTVSVTDLNTDNTVLQATLGDMMAVARGEVSDAFVWDARSPGEWAGDANSTRAVNKDCPDGTGTGNCYTAMNGTVHGAVNLNFISLLNTSDQTEDLNGDAATDGKDASYRYLDKATLSTMVSDLGYQSGQTVYTYCRTTYRAMVTGTATGVILGYPTRYYDGAMIEWLQMANYQNKTGGTNLPSTSPWQTEALTDNLTFNASSDVDEPVIIDAYAASSNAVVDEDRDYKLSTITTDESSDTTDDSDSSSGGAPIPNGCG